MDLRRSSLALLLLVTVLSLGDVDGANKPKTTTTPESEHEKEKETTPVPTRAPEPLPVCDGSCSLPHCYCNSTQIPGGLSPADTPQMVLFTFNDPVTEKVMSSSRISHLVSGKGNVFIAFSHPVSQARHSMLCISSTFCTN